MDKESRFSSIQILARDVAVLMQNAKDCKDAAMEVGDTEAFEYWGGQADAYRTVLKMKIALEDVLDD